MQGLDHLGIEFMKAEREKSVIYVFHIRSFHLELLK